MFPKVPEGYRRLRYSDGSTRKCIVCAVCGGALAIGVYPVTAPAYETILPDFLTHAEKFHPRETSGETLYLVAIGAAGAENNG